MAAAKKHKVASRFRGAQLEPAHFDLLARDAESWLNCGVDLLRGARALTRQIIVDNAWDALHGGDDPKGDFLKSGHPRMIKPVLLLSALGAELGFKAVMVSRLPTFPMPPSGKLDDGLKSHDLKKLSDLAGIPAITSLEEQAVLDGKQIIEWAARYPLPLSGGPSRRRYGTDLRDAYERLFLRCVEGVAREQYRHTPRLHATPVEVHAASERRRFEHALTGISAPRPGEEEVVGMRALEAVVWSGRGALSVWMQEDNFLSEALGVPLVHGSLNLYAAGSHHLFGQNVHAASCRAQGYVRACPCTVGGHDAFIVNVDPKNGRDPIPQPNTMFEIVASVRLRDALGLADLAAVTLTFNAGDVKDYRP